MQANLWHKLSHFYYVLLNQESLGSKGKNYKSLNISETKRAFEMK